FWCQWSTKPTGFLACLPPPSPVFQRPQIQPPRANQHIMMVNHLPMPYPMPQGPQYCIPQYRHSGPPYVGPPQQYPVQPPGPGPFYPGPGPGEFPNAYGKMSPYCALLSSSVLPPIVMFFLFPPFSSLPPHVLFFPMYIMVWFSSFFLKFIYFSSFLFFCLTGPFSPACLPACLLAFPRCQFLCSHAHYHPFLYLKSQQQLPGQVPEHSPVACGTVDASPLPASSPIATTGGLKQEEKPKTDPVLKSPSPALRPEPSGERKEQAGLAVETPPCPETSLEPPGPAGAPSLAVVPPSRSPLAPGSQDGCELASPPQEAPPPLPRAGPCLELPSCPLEEEADPERCREEPSRIVPNDLHQTPSANLINELNGVPKECSSVTASRTSAEAKEAVLPALELAVKNGGGIARPASWLFPAPLTPPRPPHSPLALPVAPPPSCPVSSPLAFPPLRGQCCSAHPPGDLDREGPPTDSEDPPNAKEEVEMDGREKKKKKRTWKGDFRAQCQDRPGRRWVSRASAFPSRGGTWEHGSAAPAWLSLELKSAQDPSCSRPALGVGGK
uniref:Eukaryotic translation initiation factor 4 gamma 3 n=1 Tax=Naja naja TaxID=35670 RepID=A0A8C6YH03_NAJNA